MVIDLFYSFTLVEDKAIIRKRVSDAFTYSGFVSYILDLDFLVHLKTYSRCIFLMSKSYLDLVCILTSNIINYYLLLKKKYIVVRTFSTIYSCVVLHIDKKSSLRTLVVKCLKMLCCLHYKTEINKSSICQSLLFNSYTYIIYIYTHLCIRVKEIIVYEKKNNLTLILTPHYRNVVIIPISIYINNIIYCMRMTSRAICRVILYIHIIIIINPITVVVAVVIVVFVVVVV
ncbi:hypothetical protein AGLY_008226 [Aphis glycines]|uniref:Uncharacterized protein n=1 Tax=Aphis glycines TaxID=307491 RepID=A0A6G0TM37_APHGL|nr:hypothetical protein AGLY_008226 [Aphis glycines]